MFTSQGSSLGASSVSRPKQRLVHPLKVIIPICFDFSTIFTKRVEIIPIKNTLSTRIENRFHRKIISERWTPRIFFTDIGKEFVNRIMAPQRRERKFGRSTIFAKYQKIFINRVYTSISQFWKAIRTNRNIKQGFSRHRRNRNTELSKWVKKLNRLKIVKEEV